MNIGKLSNQQLDEIIFSKIKYKDKRVLIGSGIGEDCSIIDFQDELCVISSDPITATNSNMGRLAVYVSCNDIASKGVRPFAIMITLLIPPSADIKEIRQVMEDIIEVCYELNIELVGGHTEVTDAVNRMVISVTCIGSGSKDYLMDKSKKAEVGDLLVMTKYAGCEGTTILFSDFKDRLSEILTHEDKMALNTLFDSLSVIKEGLLAAEVGVKTMHDATEGGILGGAWEIAEKSKLGIEIDIDSIPVLPITKKISDHFTIDPYKLISSGVMLMVVSKDKNTLLMDKLKDNGIKGTVIATFTESDSHIIYKSGRREPLQAPEADELYKAYEIG